MRFASPLWLLLLLPVALWCWHSLRRTPRRTLQEAIVVRGLVAVLLVLGVAGLQISGGPSDMAVIAVLDRSASTARTHDDDIERLNGLMEGMRAGDRFGLVVFGAYAGVERRLASRAPLTRIAARVDPNGTDIAGAIRLARSELAGVETATRHIVLLSDGRQNAGDAVREAAFAAADGVTIDAVPTVSPAARPMRVARVSAPAHVRLDEPFAVVVTVEGEPGATGEVRLRRNTEMLPSRPVVVPETGTGYVTFVDRRSESGIETYRAAMQAASAADPDAVAGGATNDAGAVVVVSGEARVLYIGGTPGGLAAGLGRSGFRVDYRTIESVARDLPPLAPYDSLVLDDLPVDSLDTAQREAIAAYVERGGGLLFLGGPSSVDAAWEATDPIARVLPVDFSPRAGRRAPALALVIVLDASGSMEDRIDGVPRIEFGRRAVARAIDLLPPTDAVGVIAFTTAARPVLPLATGHGPASLGAALENVSAAGATALTPGLELARAWLEGPAAAAFARRQIILVSDGETDAADADRALAVVRGTGIEVSTVSLGSGDDDARLERLSNATGGRAFRAGDVRDLPAIVAREAVRAAGGGVVEEPFRLRAESHPLQTAAGIDKDEMPQLGGYVVGATRPGAASVLISPLGDPVLAVWQVGLGRAAVYTADVHGGWSARLRSWDRFGPLFEQATRWVGRQMLDEALFVDVRPWNAGATVVAEIPLGFDTRATAAGETAAFDVRGSLQTPSGGIVPFVLTLAAPGRYERELPLAEAGPYVMTLAASGPEGDSEYRTTRGFYWSAPAEHGSRGPDLELLGALAEATGGVRLDRDARPFAGPRAAEYLDARPWAAAAALALFLAQLLVPGGIARAVARLRPRRGTSAARKMAREAA